MRDHDKISCKAHTMGEIGSKSAFFMNFEGRSGTAVNHSMITLKWLADEFPKKGPSKSLKGMEKLFAKHNLACFLHRSFIKHHANSLPLLRKV